MSVYGQRDRTDQGRLPLLCPRHRPLRQSRSLRHLRRSQPLQLMRGRSLPVQRAEAFVRQMVPRYWCQTRGSDLTEKEPIEVQGSIRLGQIHSQWTSTCSILERALLGHFRAIPTASFQFSPRAPSRRPLRMALPIPKLAKGVRDTPGDEKQVNRSAKGIFVQWIGVNCKVSAGDCADQISSASLQAGAFAV